MIIFHTFFVILKSQITQHIILSKTQKQIILNIKWKKKLVSEDHLYPVGPADSF